MTALASTDVVVTLSPRNRDIAPATPKLIQLATVAFGNGSLTYPTNGVPLPAIGKFGYKRAIEFCAIEQPLNGLVYRYDRANHKLLIFNQGIATGATAAADATSGALALNNAGAEGAVRLMGSSVSTTYHFGALKELPATHAPAAVTLYLLLIGE